MLNGFLIKTIIDKIINIINVKYEINLILFDNKVSGFVENTTIHENVTDSIGHYHP